MKTIARNSNNDIYLSAGQLAIASDKKAQAQIIDAIIKTQKGELLYDTERGIPYFESVFDSRKKIGAWASAVSKAISDCSFVSGIKSFTYDVDTNNILSYNIEVTTSLGTVVLNG